MSLLKARRVGVLTLSALLLIFGAQGGTAPAATPNPIPSLSVNGTSKVSAPPKKVESKTAKKTTKRKYVRREVKPIPSPSPKWPPSNFSKSKGGTIYAKIPSANELKSYASNSIDLTWALQDCEKFTCGALFLTSETGCDWWEVNSTVTGPSRSASGGREPYGTLKSFANGSSAKRIIAVLLKSSEPLHQGVVIEGITAYCRSGVKPDGVPGNSYSPIPTASPTNS